MKVRDNIMIDMTDARRRYRVAKRYEDFMIQKRPEDAKDNGITNKNGIYKAIQWAENI